MYSYEALLRECPVKIDEFSPLPDDLEGLYVETPLNKVILISHRLCTVNEKTCVLAEELGHYHTTVGNITDQTSLANRKQELQARQWAYFRLLPLGRIVEAYHAKVKGRHEIAEYLNVTEEFLQAAIDRYRDKYGLYKEVDDRYVVYFEPLAVLEIFE